jgi:hypothetical protein
MKQSNNLGATDEEVKTSLREDVALAFKLCNQQRARIATLERELAAKPKQYEFLNPDFLALVNDIGRLGHEKFGADAIESSGDRTRKLPRHQANMLHAYRHITAYEDGVKHDKLGTLQAQLAAAAFNCMLEFWFSQGE